MTPEQKSQAYQAARDRLLLSRGDWLEWRELQSILYQEYKRINRSFSGQPAWNIVQRLYEEQKFLALRPGVIEHGFEVEVQTEGEPRVVEFRIGDILERAGENGLKHLRNGREIRPGITFHAELVNAPQQPKL